MTPAIVAKSFACAIPAPADSAADRGLRGFRCIRGKWK